MEAIDWIGQEIQGYTLTKKLGSGGYGTVYLGVKEDLGEEYRTAVKCISIPDGDGYEAVLQDYGYDKESVLAYFENMVEGITSEINTLLELSKKDNRYIVAYYDHEIRKIPEPLRFDIFLRMEYLTPLNTHIRQNGMTLKEVIHLGLNMCDALILCHEKGVIHRDIKEANIFVSEDGAYKLGDFGVAKAAIETTQTGSIKGTASYMAPEIYLRETYDTSVDIYSLGIVLYKLLNNQRLPFMPAAPQPFTVDDKNAAETRRLKGEKPPLPVNGGGKIGEIIVKACSVREERYRKAEDMRRDLQEFMEALGEEEAESIVVHKNLEQEADSISFTRTEGGTITMGAQPRAASRQITPTGQNPYAEKSTKKKAGKRVWKMIGIVCVLAVLVSAYIFFSREFNPVNLFRKAVEENDFIKAGQLYQEKLADGSSEEQSDAASFLVDYGEEIREKYYRGEIAYEDALNQLQEMGKLGVVSMDTLKPMIDAVNEMRTSRAAYENAQSEMESGDYETAIADLHKVIQTDVNYENAQAQLADAIKGYKETVLSSLSEYDSEKQYEEAIMALKAGLLIVPDDADFLAAVKDYEKKIEDEISLTIDSIIRTAQSNAFVSGNYEAALTELQTAVEQYPTSEDLKAAVQEMEEAYVQNMLAQAEPLAEESEYEEAVELLNGALQYVPENTSIMSAIEEYESRYPVLLQQLTYFTGESLINGGQEKDNMQGMQTNIVLTDAGNGNEFDNVYKLEGKYKRMTGTLYQPFNERSNMYVMTLEIFGDGRLLYSVDMRGGIEPVSFEVDLTGVSSLEVNLYRSNGWNHGYGCLANVELYQ